MRDLETELWLRHSGVSALQVGPLALVCACLHSEVTVSLRESRA